VHFKSFLFTLKKHCLNTAALATVSLCILPICASANDQNVKADTLKHLTDMRQENVKRLKEIDQTLSAKIENSSASVVEAEVNGLKEARREHSLRQQFLDRLIFQVDTKFIGGDLRDFLEKALIDMAKVEAVSSTTDSNLWKFFKYASDAVRRLPEQKENIVGFLEGYMNRSVSNPMRPEDYISTRNYTNGTQSESGSPMNREDVGDIADRRIHEMEPIELPVPGTHSAPLNPANSAVAIPTRQ
jgi:hypothetical protein